MDGAGRLHSPAGVLEERQFSWVSGVLRGAARAADRARGWDFKAGCVPSDPARRAAGAARARSSISRRVSVSAEYSTTLRLMTVRCQPIYVTQQRDQPVACSLRLFFRKPTAAQHRAAPMIRTANGT